MSGLGAIAEANERDNIEREKRDTYLRMAEDGLMRMVGFASSEFVQGFETRLADKHFAEQLRERLGKDVKKTNELKQGAANLVSILTKLGKR